MLWLGTLSYIGRGKETIEENLLWGIFLEGRRGRGDGREK